MCNFRSLDNGIWTDDNTGVTIGCGNPYGTDILCPSYATSILSHENGGKEMSLVFAWQTHRGVLIASDSKNTNRQQPELSHTHETKIFRAPHNIAVALTGLNTFVIGDEILKLNDLINRVGDDGTTPYYLLELLFQQMSVSIWPNDIHLFAVQCRESKNPVFTEAAWATLDYSTVSNDWKFSTYTSRNALVYGAGVEWARNLAVQARYDINASPISLIPLARKLMSSVMDICQVIGETSIGGDIQIAILTPNTFDFA